MDDLRWFASDLYTGLIVPVLRRLGLAIATGGERAARLAAAMSGHPAVQGGASPGSKAPGSSSTCGTSRPEAWGADGPVRSGGLLGRFLRIPLLDDPERRRRLGQAARQRIESEFPLARMIDRYEAALNAVIE